MGKKEEISKKQLIQLYKKKKYSQCRIAKMLNCSRDTISNRLALFGIEKEIKKHRLYLPQSICKLYKNGKTTIEIARIYRCSPCTINLRLRKYGTKINSNPQYKHIPKKILNNLYIEKKLSPRQIAKKLGCDKNTVREKLKKYGFKIRNHSEAGILVKREEIYKIPPKKLEELYHDKKLSMQQIAEKYGLYNSTIYHKFKKYKIISRSVKEGIDLSIPRRSRSVAKAIIKYPKKVFSGNLIEKAYLFGFAIGDLRVSKNKYGITTRVETSTTKLDQLGLVINLFNKYTHVAFSKSKSGQYAISCNLDESFEFLLDYKNDNIPRWVMKRQISFLSFLAGYIDAEGHFGVSRGIGAFALGSYQKNILFQIADKLKEFDISVEGPILSVKKGFIDKRGVRWNGDLWSLRIRRMRELYRFIQLIKQLVKHKKRYSDLLTVENNLLNRNGRINLKNEEG